MRAGRPRSRIVSPFMMRKSYSNIFIRCATLFVLLSASVFACSAQNAPAVLKVEPPNWWVGHTLNPVRVLIRGKNLTGARVEAIGAGLKTGLTRINAAGTYLFVDVLIDSNAKPGRRTLRITTT